MFNRNGRITPQQPQEGSPTPETSEAAQQVISITKEADKVVSPLQDLYRLELVETALLQLKADANKEKLSKLKKEKERKKKELEELKRVVESRTNDIVKKAQSERRLEMDLRDLQKEVEQLKLAKLGLNQKKEQEGDRAREAASKMTGLAEKIESGYAQNSEVKTETKQIKEENVGLEKNVQKLMKTFTNQQSQLKDIPGSIEKMEKDDTQKQKRNHELRQQLQGMTDEFQEYDTKCEQHESGIVKCLGWGVTLQNQIGQQKTQLKYTNEAIANAEEREKLVQAYGRIYMNELRIKLEQLPIMGNEGLQRITGHFYAEQNPLLERRLCKQTPSQGTNLVENRNRSGSDQTQPGSASGTQNQTEQSEAVGCSASRNAPPNGRAASSPPGTID